MKIVFSTALSEKIKHKNNVLKYKNKNQIGNVIIRYTKFVYKNN